MKRSILRWASALLLTTGLALQVRADSIINNFDVARNYVANGILGETNWDGVYLKFGDIPFGNAGGSGNGATVLGDTVFAPGFLTVSTTRSDWSAAGDDGFYAWKLVSGDFDVSVESVPPWQNQNNNFGGLLVRAWNTNQSGSPFSFTSTNASENWLALFRAQEFSIGEIRQATNGGNFENTFPESSSDTNTSRFYRITRVANTFSFYVKTNAGDGWTLITNASNGGGYIKASGSVTRPDWNGQPVQVGIAQAVFATPAAPAQDFFTDFELSGANVSLGTPTLPGTPSAITTTATNIGGSISLSWTVGTPGDSSLVIVKRGGGILVNPIQGLAYNANTAFGTTNTLMGADQYVVYGGTANSVTVTNLSANVFTYTVAVYEYTNTGSALIYNTASPTTNFFVGPGVINSVNLAPLGTNVPIGGATAIKLFATFSTGESNFDQTALTSWSSSDPTIAAVNPQTGVVTGMATGSATITATFGNFTPTIVINVTAPFAFADNFTSTNDYLANGIIGSKYDGLYLNFGDVPGIIGPGADGPGFTVTMDSQITTTNGLFLSSVQSTWEGTNDDGAFLFKTVPGTNQLVSGDFQASLHINNMNNLNGVVGGLMARLFNPADHSRGPNNAENHVNYWKVQNGTTSVRVTRGGTLSTLFGAGPSATDGWLLIQRVNSTNFNFYERATTNDLWIFTTNTVLLQASNNAPMEVGPAQQSTAGVNGITTYDSFNVDALGMVSATPVPAAPGGLVTTLNGDLSITLNWVAADGLGNPVPSLVVMRQGLPVSAQPPVGATPTGNSVFGTGSNLGSSNYVVFVSANPPASTNNTVTVTGLTSGQLYYATVYTYAGTGTAKVINPAGVSGNLIDAAITNIATSVSGGIPLGGIGRVLIQGVTSTGQLIPIATIGATYTSDNTNVIKILAGVLTGITNGNANITTVLSAFTNTVAVTVRPPSFTDEFTVAHDYLVDGITNTSWDGLYNPKGGSNPIPGSTYVPLANSGTTVATVGPVTNVVNVTNIVGTTTNVVPVTNVVDALTMLGSGDGWENNNSGGFFLYKFVPGNFQASVHVQAFQVLGFNQPGILARAYSVSNGVSGYPAGYSIVNAGGTNDNREYWIDLTRFDESNIGTYARRNLDGAVSQNTQTDQNDTNYWLLIIRTGDGSQFDFYKRATITDPWKQVPNKTHYSIPQFAGRSMQVGLMSGPWNGNVTAQLSVSFNHFLLDVLPPSLTASPAGAGNVLISWPVGGSFTLQATPSLSPANWQTVTDPLGSSNGLQTLTVPTTNSTEFFRLVQ